MHWKKIVLGGLLLPIMTITLVACSSKPGTKVTNQSNRTANAESYPMYAGSGYSGSQRRDAAGRVINPLSAPANQTYYFAFDKSRVRNADLTALEIQARYLAVHPNKQVRLLGNTDDIGSREYNIGLGWRRDQTVGQLLMQYGVHKSQIKMVSYGKERPARLGYTQSDRALNRRVQLVYEAG